MRERITHLDFKRGRVSARNLVGEVWQEPLAAESIEITTKWALSEDANWMS
jgi:hypothetical protein